MRKAILFTASLLFCSTLFCPKAFAQSPNVLQCRVELLDGNGSTLVARSSIAKQFQSFTLDLAKDPDLGWMHQNLCVAKSDYRKAKFSGVLCLVLITTRAPAQANGRPALSLYLGIQPQSTGGLGGALSPTSGDSTDAILPIDQAGQELSYQQFFGGSVATSLSSVKLSCRR